jgi:hypothetical protein
MEKFIEFRSRKIALAVDHCRRQLPAALSTLQTLDGSVRRHYRATRFISLLERFHVEIVSFVFRFCFTFVALLSQFIPKQRAFISV